MPSLFFLPGFNGFGKSVLGRAFSREGQQHGGGRHRGGRGGRTNVKKTSPTPLRENMKRVVGRNTRVAEEPVD
uniref:Uncharacterized protein n=1 Tax=Oryza glumipatula TaxID=40148 RepID=A0A0E0AJM9_9ORYZ